MWAYQLAAKFRVRTKFGHNNRFIRRRKYGTTSASNHGFFFNQRLLRGLGCGNGKFAGVNSFHASTVFVNEDFRDTPKRYF